MTVALTSRSCEDRGQAGLFPNGAGTYIQRCGGILLFLYQPAPLVGFRYVQPQFQPKPTQTNPNPHRSHDHGREQSTGLEGGLIESEGLIFFMFDYAYAAPLSSESTH